MYTVYCIDENGEKYLETECATMDHVSSMLDAWVHQAGMDAPEFKEHELPQAYEAFMAEQRFGITFDGNAASDLAIALHGKGATAAH